VAARLWRPEALGEALEALAAANPRILAGGTDLYPSLRDRPVDFDVLDISRIAALRGVAREAAGWRIGALARWRDVLEAPLPAAFDGLKAAAREVGSVQIQNAGTVVGNVCNASPAADGSPPLLTLDARVEILWRGGRRETPLAGFLLGPRRTSLGPREMVSALLIPDPPAGARSAFLKLGARVYLVISIGMVAVLLVPDDAGRVRFARVAVGACSAVAARLPALEAALVGRSMADLAAAVAPAQFAPLSPIDDIRASGAYRLRAAEELTRRALAALETKAAA